MPRNTEYLIAAYGIVSSVVIIYTIVIFTKLRSINSKIKHLKQAKQNEDEQP